MTVDKSENLVLCPVCLGKGTYAAKINDRKRGCYNGEAECPCCEGRKMVGEVEQKEWSAKYSLNTPAHDEAFAHLHEAGKGLKL